MVSQKPLVRMIPYLARDTHSLKPEQGSNAFVKTGMCNIILMSVMDTLIVRFTQISYAMGMSYNTVQILTLSIVQNVTASILTRVLSHMEASLASRSFPDPV